jgi:MFS superfamily sulfate permease-like transporter
MGINYWLRYAGSDIMITDGYLVNLPNIKDPEVFKESFVLPDWSIILDPIVWKVAIVIAVIASLETLLSVEAVDNLDPHKRKTDKDQELKAQGVGNIIAGMIGGIPMTAVIVRSTANLESGARSKMSAIYHGIFLAGCVVLIPFVLNDIPLAALAAILLMVGYKLSKPSLYINMWKAGKSQFIPFIITIAAILIEDLLVGILIGLGVGIIFILKANYDNSHFYDEIQEPEGGYKKKITIRLSEHVSFLNKSGLINRFEKVQPNTHVVIDAKDSLFIDYDVMGIINDFIICFRFCDMYFYDNSLCLKDEPLPIKSDYGKYYTDNAHRVMLRRRYVLYTLLSKTSIDDNVIRMILSYMSYIPRVSDETL